MRRFYTTLLAVIFTASLFAQSPQKMSYQAVIRNSSDQLVTNHAVGMRISILRGSSSGTTVYVETQIPATNTNGLVSIEIGGGTPVTGTFAGIDWSSGLYFIKTESDPTGGTGYTITGTSQLLSVPYALYAKTAGGHYIGELFGGGIVIAVWKVAGVEKGLIASLTDISTVIPWSNITSTEIGVTAQDKIDGQPNTNAIISQPGQTSSAAKLCDDYTNVNTGTGIYSDWYLPSILELNQCYFASYVVNTILGVTNGFKFYTNATYWSSTEFSNATAYAIDFSYYVFCTVTGGDKGINLNLVRAVRKF
jgi:hypothetical protein